MFKSLDPKFSKSLQKSERFDKVLYFRGFCLHRMLFHQRVINVTVVGTKGLGEEHILVCGKEKRLFCGKEKFYSV